MSMTFHHYIRVLTEVVYPEDGPYFHKWDYFSISDEELPERFRPTPNKVGSASDNNMKYLHPLSSELYDWLNEGGYWIKGWQEISPDQEKWLDENDILAGQQTETTLEAEFI
jgi:hypothetical protein